MARDADPPPEGERPSPVFQPMERRAGLGGLASHRLRQAALRPKAPRPSPALVLRRSAVWARAIARYLFWISWDTLRGRGTLQHRAQRIRQTLERARDTGPKIARQLSMRLDLMPLTFALELGEVQDRRPPMALESAVAAIEKLTGHAMAEVFQVFDPQPIASTSAECIYQATLTDGTLVAVKVRRPGIRTLVMADLVALGWQTRILEMLTLVRPGAFDYLRSELLDQANDELDYGLQARYQTLFRRRTRRDHFRCADAPKVWNELSNYRVMVSEFVPGVRCSEVIDVVERGDAAGLKRLADLNIDPIEVSRRLLQISWWSSFENLFFLADPGAENIVVEPGNRIVFLSFANCSTLSGKNRRFYRQMLTHLSKDDVSGAAQSIVQLLSPLPFIDVYEFSKRIEAGLWQELFAMRDAKAQWWERSTAGIWRVVLREARSDGVNVRLDVLRLMRSALALDTIAARLNPRLKLLKEFRRYTQRADRRKARAFLKSASTSDPSQAQARLLSTASRAFDGMQRLGIWVESTVESLPVANLALSGKAATVVAESVRFLVRVLVVLVGSVAVVVLHHLWRGELPSWWQDLSTAATHPATLTLLGLLALLTTRRILFRLDDKGADA